MELFLPAMWHDHDIAGQYYDVRVICILVYAVTLYNSFQITSVYYVGHWTDCGPLNNIGRDVQHRRCAAAIPRIHGAFVPRKIWTWTRFNGHV